MTKRDHQQTTALVVEDIQDELYVTRVLLEQCGCRVLEATDGDEAVAVALRERPDMIFMDIKLPNMDGFEAARRIRSYREMRDAPMIAYTAYYSYSLTERAVEAGFDEYIVKPVTFEEMQKLVDRLSPDRSGH